MYLNPDSIIKTERIPVRKPHECVSCLAEIPKGTEAFAVSYRHDGKLYKRYHHITCTLNDPWITISNEASEEPSVEVVVENAAGQKGYGWLKYSPIHGWYAGETGEIVGVVKYKYV